MTEPFPQPRIDVTGLDAATAHTKIVDQARTLLSTPDSRLYFTPDILEAVDATWHGVIRVLERHAPGFTVGAGVILCDHAPHVDAGDTFPCPDYLDVAAGLATGLDAIALPARGDHRA